MLSTIFSTERQQGAHFISALRHPDRIGEDRRFVLVLFGVAAADTISRFDRDSPAQGRQSPAGAGLASKED